MPLSVISWIVFSFSAACQGLPYFNVRRVVRAQGIFAECFGQPPIASRMVHRSMESKRQARARPCAPASRCIHRGALKQWNSASQQRMGSVATGYLAESGVDLYTKSNEKK